MRMVPTNGIVAPVQNRRREVSSPFEAVPVEAVNCATRTAKNFVAMDNRKQLKAVRQIKEKHAAEVTPDVDLSITSEFDLAEVDDAAERRAGFSRRIAELQQDDFTSPAGTPTSSSERRKEALSGGGGLSNSQIAEHYNNCIRLCTENKINTKNAFNLHLIDYLRQITLGNSVGEMNFQMAGTSIDASAKIYAYRVDVVHQETYRMIGGLGRGDKSDRNKGRAQSPNALGGDDDQDDNHEPLDNEDITASKRRKKKKGWKGKTIEKNSRNITAPLTEMEHEKDALYHKICSTFDEGGTSGLLLNNVFSKNNTSYLVLHSYGAPAAASQTRSISRVSNAKISDSLKPVLNRNYSTICQPLSNLKLDERESSSEDESHMDAQRMPLQNNNVQNNEFKFVEPERLAGRGEPDMIADRTGLGGFPASLPEDHEFGSDGELGGDGDSLAMDFDDNRSVRSFQSTSSVIDRLAPFIATKPQEYSYFNQSILQCWAGPSHWKLLRKDPVPAANEKKTGQRMKKECVQLEFPSDRSLTRIPFQNALFENIVKRLVAILREESPGRYNNASSRVSSFMTKATLEKWSNTETVVDPAVEYCAKGFHQLFLKPKHEVYKDKAARSTPEPAIDDDVGEYNYGNAADVEQFCPDQPMDGPQLPLDFGDADGDSSFAQDGFHTPSDSPLPNTVEGEQLPVPGASPLDTELVKGPAFKAPDLNQLKYDRVAKRIDVRRLKQTMWAILTEAKPDTTLASPTTSHESVVGLHTFTTLYDALLSRLPPIMRADITPHIAFVVFLHMCNEKNLELHGQQDKCDFEIRQS